MGSVLSPRLVARTSERAALQDAAAAALAGRGRALAVRGDAGLGKSRLVEQCARDARARGLVVATGRCTEVGAGTPLRALAEAVTRVVRRRPVPEEPGLRPYLPVLSRLAPDLLPDGPATADADPVHLGEGLVRLLRALARGAAGLLVIEDLHLADPMTLAVCEYVADVIAAEDEPVSVVLTVRPTPSGAGSALVDALAGRRSARVLTLAPLPPEETRELVHACRPDLDAAVVEVVVERSGGVPLLVEDLLATGEASPGPLQPAELARVVPLSFADAVRRRLAGLQAEAQRVLALLAVAGEGASPALLAAAIARPLDDVLADLESARTAQLLDASRPCSFRHALTRDAVLAQLLPAQRSALARTLVTVAPAVGADPALVAALAVQSGDEQGAARALLEAGEHALDRGYPGSAETSLSQAEQLATAAGDRALAGRVRRRRLAALAMVGRPDDVLSLADRLPPEERDGPAGRDVRMCLARSALDAGRYARAEDELAPLLPDDVEATALAALVGLAGGHLEVAEGRARTVLDRDGAPPPAVCEAWEVLGRLLRPRDLAGAEACFTAARDAARRAGLALYEARALHELGTVSMFLSGRPDRLHEAREQAVRLGAVTASTVLDVQIASCSVMALELPPAEERAIAAAQVAKRIGARPLHAAATVVLAQAAAYGGDWDRASGHAAAVQVLTDGDSEPLAMLAGLVDGLGGLLAEDRDRARRGFDELGRLLPHAPGMPPTPAQALRILLGAVDGSPWAGDAARAATTSGLATVPYNAALLAQARAVTAGRCGSVEQAQQEMASAMAAVRGSNPGPVVLHLLHLGGRLVAEAALHDGWGDPVSWSRDALVALERPAPRVAAACRELLHAAGARAPRPVREHAVPPALRRLGVTVREHEVLQHVARGAGNRDVARALQLSPRTVETHVARLLAKTGAARRSDLAGWVDAEGQ